MCPLNHFQCWTPSDWILPHVNLILSLVGDHDDLQGPPTVAMSGIKGQGRVADVVGIAKDNFGTKKNIPVEATLVTLTEGSEADTDLLALETLYERTKFMLARARHGYRQYQPFDGLLSELDDDL